jgi:hypothetical protein
VFIERKPTALRAATLLKHEATKYKNHQSQHDYRNQHPFGHNYPLRRLRSFCDGGCGSAEPARAGLCSGSAALRRERISIQTSRAIEMAVNPPTRMCEASMVLFSLSVFSTGGRDWTSPRTGLGPSQHWFSSSSGCTCGFRSIFHPQNAEAPHARGDLPFNCRTGAVPKQARADGREHRDPVLRDVSFRGKNDLIGCYPATG